MHFLRFPLGLVLFGPQSFLRILRPDDLSTQLKRKLESVQDFFCQLTYLVTYCFTRLNTNTCDNIKKMLCLIYNNVLKFANAFGSNHIVLKKNKCSEVAFSTRSLSFRLFFVMVRSGLLGLLLLGLLVTIIILFFRFHKIFFTLSFKILRSRIVLGALIIVVLMNFL